MSDSQRPSLASRPTADQIARFAKLTPEQRFHWPVDTLALCYELSPPEVQAQWPNHKASGV
jgi:hypothetical protein